MRAEIAFCGRVAFRVKIERVVGTGLHARLASDAAAAIEIHNSVFAAEQRPSRADLNAGGIVAMVAAHHAEMAAGVGKFPLLDVLDPGAEHADWDVVLFFASDGAGMATDAPVVVNYEAVAQLDFSARAERAGRELG
jgi:hypothetical protein